MILQWLNKVRLCGCMLDLPSRPFLHCHGAPCEPAHLLTPNVSNAHFGLQQGPRSQAVTDVLKVPAKKDDYDEENEEQLAKAKEEDPDWAPPPVCCEAWGQGAPCTLQLARMSCWAHSNPVAWSTTTRERSPIAAELGCCGQQRRGVHGW